MTTDLKQVDNKIEVESFNPMSRRNPSSRYWLVFSTWKKLFKSLNESLKDLDKVSRKMLYTQYYTQYYKQHYTALN